jgi:hypothetical protein
MRELLATQRRAAEIARTRELAAQLHADLPSLIQEQVGEHIEKLEAKLLDDFKQMGQKAIEESAAILNEQLGERIEILEQISSLQTKTIVNLRDTSKIAEQKVSSVVDSIEKTLTDAVPGFRLAASQFVSPAGIVKAEPQELEDAKSGNGFCPNCTSTNIRRANRHGIWEEFLRFFFIAPFRCRSCRHKFYRF